jgi:hypothetical protein
MPEAVRRRWWPIAQVRYAVLRLHGTLRSGNWRLLYMRIGAVFGAAWQDKADG